MVKLCWKENNRSFYNEIYLYVEQKSRLLFFINWPFQIKYIMDRNIGNHSLFQEYQRRKFLNIIDTDN